MVVPASLKFTVPVGVPAPGRLAVTVAVKVTDWPNTDGFTDELRLVVVDAWLTVCVSVALVLVVKLVSPLYTAVMLCAPTASELLLQVADAAASACAPQPVMVVPASLKFTVPVGVPAPGAVALMVAVNVTDWPNTDGFADELRLVVVDAWLTVCVSVALVLVVKLVSPLYTAVMLCAPTASELLLQVADAAASACAPQPVMVVPASLKFTVPVGVPAPGAVALMVAVNVTDWPNTDGFADELRLVVVDAWLTVCVSVALVLVVKLVSPLYTAVMLCAPTASELLLQVADAAASACAPQPVMVVPASLKFTVPVGVPAPGAVALMVAVNVTDWPNTDGFADELRLVVVDAWLTVCVSVALVLVVKLVSPLYTAVMLWAPIASELLLQVADPAASACAPQPVMVVPASLKFTVPVGVPAPGAVALMVAVKVTDWPNTDGFADELRLVVVDAWLTVCVSVALVLVVKLVSPLYTAVMLWAP